MIQIENLYKEINNNKILDNINLNINKGEIVILKGVSGSGKTTLLSIIAALDKPNSGKVLIDKKAIHKLPDIHLSQFRAKHIGIIFQNFNLIENFTPIQNLLSALSITTNNLKDANNKALKALKLAHIDYKKDEIVKHLSGGEKQRVAIARALVNNANIIICDEPTSSLDKENSIKFLNTLKDLNTLNKTIIIATHDSLFDTLDIKYHFISLEDGKIVEDKYINE